MGMEGPKDVVANCRNLPCRQLVSSRRAKFHSCRQKRGRRRGSSQSSALLQERSGSSLSHCGSLQARHRVTTQTQAYSNGAGRAVSGEPQGISELDLRYLQQVTEVADRSAGLTAPHPNAGCILVSHDGQVVAESHQRAQGSESAELQAVRIAGAAAEGGTAYLNLETGDCHGDDVSLRALIQSGISRVVVGIKNPLRHCRGLAIKELRQAGVCVDILKESVSLTNPDLVEETWQACLAVNEALLHRVVSGKPLGVLKYAMTLDGKIATSSGHSAWVTSPPARAKVFDMRARSDAVIVGGQTLRRDNPRLTTRRDGGHAPVRILMSRTLDLPPDANLWDVSIAPTIVMTQRGARREFQAHLLSKGVEVVQFDFLTPEAVASYCAERGFLQCLWECGGTLAAPAIAGGAIHKCLAFIAPKLIGGVRAPSPVGELGNVEMTQATELTETSWECIGKDMLLTGYLPSSYGPAALNSLLDAPSAAHRTNQSEAGMPQGPHMPILQPQGKNKAIEFYKAWDRYGALTNFSPHPILMPENPTANGSQSSSLEGPLREWQTLEHYYQAQKFAGVQDPEAKLLIEEIWSAASPEEAARLGRTAQRTKPNLIAHDWETAKLFVMYAGLKAKFSQHAGPRASLLSTARGEDGSPVDLVEAAPHDFFWGRGIDSTGLNHLGVLLMRVRSEIIAASRERSEVGVITSVRPHPLDSTVTAPQT